MQADAIQAEVARLQAAWDKRLKLRDEKVKGKELRPVSEYMQDAYKAIERQAVAPDGITGVRTGFCDLDAATGGMQAGGLAIVAGRPAMGKTSFALNMAVNAARHGHKVGLFSLEMSTREILVRALCTEARADSTQLRTGKLDTQSWRGIGEACVTLSMLPLYVCDRGDITAEEIEASSERKKADGGLDMVVIDYLQLMGGKRRQGDSREREVAETTRSLKIAAGRLGLAIVLVSQLNRGLENRREKVPQLSDLRESGAIEQDADLVLFVHRPNYYDKEQELRTAELVIAKNRHGPTKSCPLNWIPEYTVFTSSDRREYEC